MCIYIIWVWVWVFVFDIFLKQAVQINGVNFYFVLSFLFCYVNEYISGWEMMEEL